MSYHSYTDQEDEFTANKKHIYAMFRLHHETGIIENILSKTKDGQEAAKMIMLEYSDHHAGRAWAEELQNKLNTARIEMEMEVVVVEDAEVPGHNLMIQVFSFPGRYIHHIQRGQHFMGIHAKRWPSKARCTDCKLAWSG